MPNSKLDMFTCKNKGISLLNLDNTLILMNYMKEKYSNGNRSVFSFWYLS